LGRYGFNFLPLVFDILPETDGSDPTVKELGRAPALFRIDCIQDAEEIPISSKERPSTEQQKLFPSYSVPI